MLWIGILLPPAAAQPAIHGLPACAGPGNELAIRATIVICDNSATRTALWTACELRPEHLAASNPRRMRFRTDTGLKGAVAFDSGYRKLRLFPRTPRPRRRCRLVSGVVASQLLALQRRAPG